jgi:hypothetical protein
VDLKMVKQYWKGYNNPIPRILNIPYVVPIMCKSPTKPWFLWGVDIREKGWVEWRIKIKWFGSVRNGGRPCYTATWGRSTGKLMINPWMQWGIWFSDKPKLGP